MGGVDGHVTFQCQNDGLLDFIGPGEALEGSENDWMVAHHHVTAAPQSLGYYGWSSVEGYEDAGDFDLWVTALQAGIVVTFLVGKGCGGFQQAGQVLNGRHIFLGSNYHLTMSK